MFQTKGFGREHHCAYPALLTAQAACMVMDVHSIAIAVLNCISSSRHLQYQVAGALLRKLAREPIT